MVLTILMMAALQASATSTIPKPPTISEPSDLVARQALAVERLKWEIRRAKSNAMGAVADDYNALAVQRELDLALVLNYDLAVIDATIARWRKTEAAQQWASVRNQLQDKRNALQIHLQRLIAPTTVQVTALQRGRGKKTSPSRSPSSATSTALAKTAKDIAYLQPFLNQAKACSALLTYEEKKDGPWNPSWGETKSYFDSKAQNFKSEECVTLTWRK